MAVTKKLSTDVGVPTVTNTVGTLITLLDYLLVTTLGWTKVYSGTNKGVYRAPTGNRRYLRVDDSGSGASGARINSYETMTDVDTGTGPMPTAAQLSGGLYLPRCTTAGPCKWKFISNGTYFVLIINYNIASNYWASCVFGDVFSYKSGDAYNTVLIGEASFSNPTSSLQTLNIANTTTSTATHYAQRSFTQVGSAVLLGKTSDYIKAPRAILGGTGTNLPYPSAVDGGIYLSPLYLNEVTVGLRGQLPGLWDPLHSYPLAEGDTFSGSSGLLSGKSFECWILGTAGQMMVETSDTWSMV